MIQPHPGQEQVLASPARHRVVIGGRGWGKTSLCSLVAEQEQTGKQAGILYIAPTQALVRASWRVFKPFIDAGVLHYSTPESDYARGLAPDLLIIDSAEYIPVDYYMNVLRPCLLNGSKLLVTGTMQPEISQMQLLWDLYGKALDPENTDWQSWHFTSFNNHYLSRDELKAAEKIMPAEVYRTTILSEMPGVTTE